MRGLAPIAPWTLSDGGDIPAQARWPTSFDQGCRAEVDIAADMGKNADRRDHQCANEGDHHDFQVRSAISTIHRMIHGIFPCHIAAGGLTSTWADIVTESP